MAMIEGKVGGEYDLRRGGEKVVLYLFLIWESCGERGLGNRGKVGGI